VAMGRFNGGDGWRQMLAPVDGCCGWWLLVVLILYNQHGFLGTKIKGVWKEKGYQMQMVGV